MKELKHILLEGRIEDAQTYLQNAVGNWPIAEPDNLAGIGVGTNIQGVLTHFIQNDPSGNNKYLMWMVKKYVDPEERGTSPNDISSIVKRFHKNVDRLSVAFIMNMNIFDPSSRISTSPKNIDSYDDLSQLERVMDEVDSIQTRKEKETEAKAGVDKLYEDDRWLLVKPNTFEGSCYYGSSTKWCTTSKDNPTHFDDYSSRGNLFYIIDKSHELGDFYKIALFKSFGDEVDEWYDRADNKLGVETKDAIYSMLPQKLVTAFLDSHDNSRPPEPEDLTLDDFRDKLVAHMLSNPKLQTLSTQTGVWKWNLDQQNDVWNWESEESSREEDILDVQATPFWQGNNEIPIDFIARNNDEESYQIVVGPRTGMEIPGITQSDYLSSNHTNDQYRHRPDDWRERIFLQQIYFPNLKKFLNKDFFKFILDSDFSTWTPQSYVSTFKFKYPPREGTMTQRFVDYLKQNPRKTSNQFYEEVLGYSRPRAHNNMFFSSIKDSGIVKMERQGRQFVYSLGPNYQAWVEGKLRRV